TEADIVSWHVKPGDTVTINQVIVDIETAKAVVELPSPYAGTVTALLVEEGQTVDVGTPIIAVAVPGAGGGPGGQGDPGGGNPPAGARRVRRQARLDEPPAAEEAADAARFLPGHPVRAASRRSAARSGVPGRGAAVPGRTPGEGAMGEGLPHDWGGHRGGHPPGGKKAAGEAARPPSG